MVSSEKVLRLDLGDLVRLGFPPQSWYRPPLAHALFPLSCMWPHSRPPPCERRGLPHSAPQLAVRRPLASSEERAK